ncbi:hypothetical protein KFE25_012223 [Diacronema lutheri]|uniref:Beta-galactosidase n=2 Tax=Diacronema lutheri TaxID=2081491 RepID=A0A8J5XEH2_DIALT|nr:hypothetical protein KFE25_012223 [Diacronema lutheri]
MVWSSALSLLVASPALAPGGLARLAGRWHGFEQRFHASSGRPLPVPEELTPRSDLEWGTAPYGFAAELELEPADGALRAAHQRKLLWSGCFIDGPSQTAERWATARDSASVLETGCWAVGGEACAAAFRALPLAYRAPLAIAALSGEPVLLVELGILSADGTSLCLLHLAHGAPDGGPLVLPPVATFFARSERDGAALAARLGDEAQRRAADSGVASHTPAPSARGKLDLELADGLLLAVRPCVPAAGESRARAPGAAGLADFALTASWRGTCLRVQWRDSAVCTVTAAEELANVSLE